jgi:hypothetical protein
MTPDFDPEPRHYLAAIVALAGLAVIALAWWFAVLSVIAVVHGAWLLAVRDVAVSMLFEAGDQVLRLWLNRAVPELISPPPTNPFRRRRRPKR